MEEAFSKFNIAVVREVYFFGEPQYAAQLQKLLKGYYFLNMRDGDDYLQPRDDIHFLIAAVDFTNLTQLQSLARRFEEANSVLTQKLIFAVAPDALTMQHLLFAQEVGALYVAAGVNRSNDLPDYLKRVCLEIHQIGTLDKYEIEIDQAVKRGDQVALKQTIEKLKGLPGESEQMLKLLATACQHAGDLKRSEFYLKQLLRLNSQNLWAANTLGRLYLRSGRVAEGTEVLQRMSHFHELNGERLLALGEVYVQAGYTRDAEAAFAKGDKLNAGNDERFKDGLAKVKLADGDVQGALALVGERGFSPEIISFLNMRAILSIRNQKFAEGMDLYNQAVKGTSQDNEVKAKLMFNMGLAMARAGELARAQECLEESVRLGGPKFKRAQGPLQVVKKVIEVRKKEQASGTTSNAGIELMDNVEWETLY